MPNDKQKIAVIRTGSQYAIAKTLSKIALYQWL